MRNHHWRSSVDRGNRRESKKSRFPVTGEKISYLKGAPKALCCCPLVSSHQVLLAGVDGRPFSVSPSFLSGLQDSGSEQWPLSYLFPLLYVEGEIVALIKTPSNPNFTIVFTLGDDSVVLRMGPRTYPCGAPRSQGAGCWTRVDTL